MDWEQQYQYGSELFQKGCTHAALEVLTGLTGSVENDSAGALYDDIGRLYLTMARFQDAGESCKKALTLAKTIDEKALYQIHLAFIHSSISETDRGLRLIASMLPNIDEVAPLIKGKAIANLALMEYRTGSTQQALEHTYQALKIFEGNIDDHVIGSLEHNLGYIYFRQGRDRYDLAQEHLLKALDLFDGDLMPSLSALGRLYLRKGDLIESLRCAEKALARIQASVINYEKGELGEICHFLANLAAYMDEMDLARRLAEKAEVFYGQLGFWNDWQLLETEVSQWSELRPEFPIDPLLAMQATNTMMEFLHFLDAMNSQEMLHEKMSTLLDARVHYTKILADRIHLSEEDRDNLVMAARLMDYGLTALEHSVAMNPNRSEQAMRQYQQHPAFGADLVRSLHLPDAISEIIMDHHERFDGTGFPVGKMGSEIHPLARVLAVAAEYTNVVAWEDKPHSDAVQQLLSERCKSLDPDIVDTFLDLFNLSVSVAS